MGRKSCSELPTQLAVIAVALVQIVVLNNGVNGELTPPYFNLAEGRKIYATATCGEDTDGPELYCKLVGANTESENSHVYSLIQGQVCDHCDPTRPDKNHPPEYAIDGTENWWQSPPLSRSMKYNEVNLTIDFGQEFHVAYLFIRMGNSPRPGLWTLEKSRDYGKTWTPWQHFSDSPTDCETYFPGSFRAITRDDDVICTTEYSKIVPLENGEIPIMLLNNRPSANNYFNSTVLQEWTRATNVRIRLLRTKNLLGHLMSVARQDPTVTRRYFYSIKDISIGGRCMCNGHADTCHILDTSSPQRVLACQCRHNTCGIQCNECCPGFEQKKWRQNTNANPFQCEPCNCHGHSNTCIYEEQVDLNGTSLDIHGQYEGGGVCQNCQHNTEGINCNQCRSTFYRPHGHTWDEINVCQPCNCYNFNLTGNCAEETGQCECRPQFQSPNCDSCAYGYYGFPDCKKCECNLAGTDGYHCQADGRGCPCKGNFAGDYCERCADGYFNFPECVPCECNTIGSVSDVCNDVSGECQCRSNFAGNHCDRCKNGYFDYPTCTYCNCDIRGTLEEVCDKANGQCVCREGFGGPRCDQCLPGYYNYPDCVPCNCSTTGSVSAYCDASGKCPCLANFAGRQCTSCSTGYYQYPECLPCHCDSHGSNGLSCNADGQCLCNENFYGKTCDQCKEGFYNYPICEECNCDPAGVIARFAGCGSVPVGELCQCKNRVAGRICDQCKPLYWNLNITNPDGCQECECFVDGTVGALDTCDSKTGQCACKPTVRGRTCGECKDGTFDLFGGSLFGCKDCGCDIGGALSPVCDKGSGQCRCHPRVSGRTCNYPLTTHYYPTLYQYQFEYESGRTPAGSIVRFHKDETIFPEYSGKGYAHFSQLMHEVENEVHIFKSSVYRIIIRYHNPSSENIVGTITIQSDNPLEVDQSAKVLFKPTDKPQFVTVSGVKGEIPSPLVLDPGHYTFTIRIDKVIFLDYFVLLPAAYYEASVLTKKIENPCEIGNLGLCRHYHYPSIAQFEPVTEAKFTDNNESFDVAEFFTDYEHLTMLKEEQLPILTDIQSNLNYKMQVPKTGRYIVVVDYITNRNYPETDIIRVNVAGAADDDDEGVLTLYACTFTTICRQPVVDVESREKVFTFMANDPTVIVLQANNPHRIAVKSVTAIPVESWSLAYISPSPVAVIQDGVPVRGTFNLAPDSRKVEFEADHMDRVSESLPAELFDPTTKLIFLNEHDSSIMIRTKVATPGRYVILIKSYQPDHPQVTVNYRIETDRQSWDGKLTLHHCPSNIGCRELVKQQDTGYMWFDIDDNFTLTLTNNHPNGAWLDFVLLVPADQFSDMLLEEETFDTTKEFIRKCGQDHFHIQLNSSDFCKQSVFSLTADHNDGALSCGCDVDGSVSLECDPFGGQCQCKSDIVGRQCNECRDDYWGFPKCQKCDCPAIAHCDPRTGQCICPPRVTGQKCDECMPLTFGFDPLTGCEDCNCHPLGVHQDHMQCDLNNGTCQCKPNVVDRRCDKCANGHYSFPYCEQCSCDLRGTTPDICDPVDAACYCKKNVVGQDCRQCAEGSYNLQEANPDGCTKCFCFGKTTRCNPAYLRPFEVSMMNGTSINNIVIKQSVEIIPMATDMAQNTVNETTLQFKFVDEPDNMIYFGMLDTLWGNNNHLTAYGGFLTYKLFYTTGLFGNGIVGPDVVLEGKDAVYMHQSYEQPANGVLFEGAVHMIESNFQTASGKTVSREQFMTLLRDLKGIFIRANYWEGTVLSQVSDVSLTMADHDRDHVHLYQELPVEQCQCPAGYSGLSCEDCAPGYYRDKNGPHGGYCIPCQCNGHAKTCDCNTGVCHDCDHATTGDHCDMCIEGYYGNATIGSPHDCMICACPLPVESNNFATTCEVSEDGLDIHCTCREGYTGATCEACAAGFYGNPRVEGDICKPCECSGNIDPIQAGSCDSLSGECKLCLNNTAGAACNLCAPGFYGDAIKLKDCRTCVCDETGTAFCDSYVGTCHCHPNVVGEKCDRCDDDHYGFESGQGCRACDCGVASFSSQCEHNTGECRCKPGVIGRQCDRCAPGFFNYTADGCGPCLCNTDYSRGLGCNAQTGQCECLPGVVGKNCDHCPHRWVLIPESGCHECDICHHALLDGTDALRFDLDPVIEDFESVASGYFTAQKLNYHNEWADKIEPEVRALDPKGVNLNPINAEIESIEMDAKNFDRRVLYAQQNALELSISANKLRTEAENVSLDCTKSVFSAQNSIREVKKLAESLDSDVKTRVGEQAKIEAEHFLERINEKQINIEPAQKQFDAAIELSESSVQLHLESMVPSIETEKLHDGIKELQDRLEKMSDLAKESIERSTEAESLNAKNRAVTLHTKFETVSEQTKEADKHLAEAKEQLKTTEASMQQIGDNIKELDHQNYDLKDLNKEVNELLPKKNAEYNSKGEGIEAAQHHSEGLLMKAEELKEQLQNIESNSEQPLQAAKAYTNIVENVNDAKSAVQSAEQAAGNATEMTDGVDDRAGKSDQLSSQMLDDARKALDTVQSVLGPHINRSSGAVNEIVDMNKVSDATNTQINVVLDQLSDAPQTANLETAKTMADKSNKKAQNALKILTPIRESLPSDSKRAKELPSDVDKTNKDITQIINQMEEVRRIMPSLQELVNRLENRQNTTNLVSSRLGDKLGKLRHQVDMARDIANSINVGVQFHPNTTLELKKPENLQMLATNSRISTFFRTEKPNGLLMFLGNEHLPEASNSKPLDYMALEIENGYPKLVVDLGYGPEEVASHTLVSDGKWREAIVERTGNNIQLIIREELNNGSEAVERTNETLPGPHAVFNLDKDSRLFVGGLSPDFNVTESVKYSAFEGEIEDVKIGDSNVGLWNFVDGQYNTNGALERDKLKSKDPPITGYRFGGHGYVLMDTRPYSWKTRTNVKFNFRATRDAKDGLMFYSGRNRYFISIEMRDGEIVFQFKLGQHLVRMTSTAKYNDDEWHSLEAVRDGGKGVLTVDSVAMFSEETTPAGVENLKMSDTMYFGGHPGKLNHSEVTNRGFDGCIDGVHIEGVPVDLSRNLKTFGTRRGCPIKFSSTISFPPHRYGYLKQGNVSSNNYMQVNLRFRTKHEEGVLFYAANHDQSSSFGLVLYEGQLYLSSNSHVVSSSKLNDGEWHTVTGTHNSNSLRLDIDDAVHYKADLPTNGSSLLISFGEIFFGGLPRHYRVPKNTLKTTAYLVGCISDVTVNEDVVNFAESRDKENAILDNCPQDFFNYDLWTVPNYYPDEQNVALPDLRPAPPTQSPEESEDMKKQDEAKMDQPKFKPTKVPPPRTTPKPWPRPIPVPEGPKPTCQLPRVPDWDKDFDSGYRFGTGMHSRIEFKELLPRPRRGHEISMKFKTDSPDGVLFYTSDSRHTNYVALYMHNGHLVHEYQMNEMSKKNLTSKFAYHDNTWHDVTFSRSMSRRTLQVDTDDLVSEDHVEGVFKNIVWVSPSYVGGIRKEHLEDMELNLNVTKGTRFQGCINEVKSIHFDVADPSDTSNVIPCSEQVESGTFFGGDGYVRLRDKFKVGEQVAIYMDIKPRTQDAFLMSVHGKKAFLVLQMINGTISFVVDNGDGAFEAVFKPEANENFCDGSWRTIKVVKTKYVTSIQVDNVNSEAGIGPKKTTSADTSRPLFLGGHPHMAKIRGVTVRKPYVGCIRNVRITSTAEKPENIPVEMISPRMITGNAWSGVCPTL